MTDPLQNHTHETYLTGCSRGVPEGATDTVTICHTRGLQESSCPRPAADDGRRHKPGFDGSSCGAEHFRGLQLIVVPPKNIGREHHTQGEQETQSNDDSISGCCAQRRGPSRHCAGNCRSSAHALSVLATGRRTRLIQPPSHRPSMQCDSSISDITR